MGTHEAPLTDSHCPEHFHTFLFISKLAVGGSTSYLHIEDGSTEVSGTQHPDRMAIGVERCACLGFPGPFSKMWLYLLEDGSFRNESRRLLVAAVPRTEAYGAVWFVLSKGLERDKKGCSVA